MFFISFIYYTYIVELVIINFQDLLPGLLINLLCIDENKLLVLIIDILTQKYLFLGFIGWRVSVLFLSVGCCGIDN